MKKLTGGIDRTTTALFLMLLALIIPAHLTNLVRAVTIDEPWWVISGSNFYYALTHRDFENTVYDYHPAVTTTWMVTGGMLSYFPEYRSFEQGYFDVRKPKFEEFMREHGKDVLELVRRSRLIQSSLVLALAASAFFLLKKLIDPFTAFISISIAALAPYFLGHARLLNHEGMLAMFCLVSILSMQVFLEKEHKNPLYLLASGAAFGLAQLTKSSSIVVLGVISLMLLAQWLKQDNLSWGGKTKASIKHFLLWFAAAVLVYFLLWPSMWVAPGKMLAEVYGNAFSYAFQGARLDLTEQLDPQRFGLAARFDGIRAYLQNWALTSTPITWIGLIFAGLLFIAQPDQRSKRKVILYLVLLGGLFIALFGIAQGRNSLHYILTSFVCFDIAASIGWAGFLGWMQGKMKFSYLPAVASTMLIGGQVFFSAGYSPYYFTYHAPFTSQSATQGYGEGLAKAAEYLTAKPDAEQLQAYVYNGMGTFSYFFPGKTLVFKRVYLVDRDFETITQEIKESDYLVLYPATRYWHFESQPIFDALRDISPEETIMIHGVEYVTIYKVSDIPETVYETILQP